MLLNDDVLGVIIYHLGEMNPISLHMLKTVNKRFYQVVKMKINSKHKLNITVNNLIKYNTSIKIYLYHLNIFKQYVSRSSCGIFFYNTYSSVIYPLIIWSRGFIYHFGIMLGFIKIISVVI
jgi:hypothetical protein